MNRLGGVFWFVLVIASGMTNFLVKQTVQGLDDQLNSVRRKTIAEQKATHELTADWTFLNQPELLAGLNRTYVHLAPMSPKQVATNIDSIPLRPMPPEDAQQAAELRSAAPIVPVAATTPARAPSPPLAPVATPPAAQAPARALAPPAIRGASLDALFAQVVEKR